MKFLTILSVVVASAAVINAAPVSKRDEDYGKKESMEPEKPYDPYYNPWVPTDKHKHDDGYGYDIDMKDKHDGYDMKDKHDDYDMKDKHDDYDMKDKHDDYDMKDKHDDYDMKDKHDDYDIHDKRDDKKDSYDSGKKDNDKSSY